MTGIRLSFHNLIVRGSFDRKTARISKRRPTRWAIKLQPYWRAHRRRSTLVTVVAVVVDATWPRRTHTQIHKHKHAHRYTERYTYIGTYTVTEPSIRRARRRAEGSERKKANAKELELERRVRREKGTPDSCCWYTARPLRAFIARMLLDHVDWRM